MPLAMSMLMGERQQQDLPVIVMEEVMGKKTHNLEGCHLLMLLSGELLLKAACPH